MQIPINSVVPAQDNHRNSSGQCPLRPRCYSFREQERGTPRGRAHVRVAVLKLANKCWRQAPDGKGSQSCCSEWPNNSEYVLGTVLRGVRCRVAYHASWVMRIPLLEARPRLVCRSWQYSEFARRGLTIRAPRSQSHVLHSLSWSPRAPAVSI